MNAAMKIVTASPRINPSLAVGYTDLKGSSFPVCSSAPIVYFSRTIRGTLCAAVCCLAVSERTALSPTTAWRRFLCHPRTQQRCKGSVWRVH